jgi:hypothetical protein
MNGEDRVEPINILVSRDELLFVLRALEADYIPGLDPEPLGQLSNAQETVAMAVAGRALRARSLAQGPDGGELQIHTALLTMVGICAYSQNVVFVYHWPPNADVPQRFFGHLRGDDIVAHTRPEDVMHLLSLLPDKAYLIDQILTVCQWNDVPEAPAVEFNLPNPAFASVRELVDEGDLTQARQVLANSGVPASAAEALVQTLSHTPRVSIVQTVKQGADGAISRRDITLLQNGQHVWLAIAPESGATTEPLRVKTTTRAEVRGLLEGWL